MTALARKPDTLSAVLADVRALWRAVPHYAGWSDADFERLAVPPVELGQYGLAHDAQGPTGFLSWAFLSDEAQQGYIARTRKLQPGDWDSGPHLWFIDFIGIRDGVRAVVKMRNEHSFRGVKLAHSLRTVGVGEGAGTIRRVGTWHI